MSALSQTYRKLLEGKPLNTEEIGQLVRGFEAQEDVKDTLAKYLDFGARDLSIPMPYSIIYDTVLTEDAASIEVPITGDGNHLIIYFTGRTNGTGGSSANDLYVVVNSDTAAHYEWQAFAGHNASSAISQSLSDTGLRLAIVQSDGAAAGLAGTVEARIEHIRSQYKKNCVCNWGFPLGSGDVWTGQFFSQWSGTDPIINLTFQGDVATYPNVKIEAGSLLTVVRVG